MGAVKVFLAAVIFSFSGVLSKWMPWSALSLVGARAVVASVVMAMWRRDFRVKTNPGVWMGAVSVCLTSVLFLFANKLTTAANAIVLQYAMPVFVIALCAVFYHQKPTRRDIVAAACVLVGVILCFLDNLGGGGILGDFLAILSALTYALVFFAARLSRCEASDYTYLGNVISGLFVVNLFFDPAVSAAEPVSWLVAGVMGVALSLGYILLSSGIRDVEPVAAAIVSNVEPVLNPLWVFLALGETPGVTALVGAAVVLGTVTVYSLRKRAVN